MKRESKGDKKYSIAYEVLKIVAVAGGITIFLLLPGLSAALAPFIRAQGRKRPDLIARERGLTTIVRLKQRGIFRENHEHKLTLTTKGQRLLMRYKLKYFKPNKPKKWDGKWRLVAFDVWEKRKSSRDLLRKILKECGFIQLQASI